MTQNIFSIKCVHFCTGTSWEGEKRFHSSTAVIMFWNTMDFVICTLNVIQYSCI